MSIKKIPSSSEARLNKILDLRNYFNTGSNPQVYWEYSGSEILPNTTAAIPVNRKLYLQNAPPPSGIPLSSADNVNNLASAFKVKGVEGSVFTLKMYDYKSGLTPQADTTCFSQKMTVDIPTPYVPYNNNMDKLQAGYYGDGIPDFATGVLTYNKNPIKILLTCKSPVGGWNKGFWGGERTYSQSYVKLYVGANYDNESGFVTELAAESADASDRRAQVTTKIVEIPAKFIGTTEFESGINVRITFRYALGSDGCNVPTNDPPNIYGWAEVVN